MPPGKKTASAVTVIFTPEGFHLDIPDTLMDPWSLHVRKLYEEDRWNLLFQWGFDPPRSGDDASLIFLHTLGARFVRTLSAQPGLEVTREETVVPLTETDEADLLSAVPFGLGTEHVDTGWIRMCYQSLTECFRRSVAVYEGTVAMFLTEKSQNLRIPERVFFHLVENRRAGEDPDPRFPFAFLATYSTRIEGKVQHQPLSYALTEFRGQKEKLVDLLSCLNEAAGVSPLIAGFMDSGELFHPLKLTTEEAWDFLKSAEAIEKAGISCRLPNWWRRRASSVSVSVKLGDKPASLLGLDSIISMTPSLTVDGEKLTKAEIRTLLSMAEGLTMIKGKWVEVDHARLRELLSLMDRYQGDLSMLDALRMQSGMSGTGEDQEVRVTHGAWLQKLLSTLRDPSRGRKIPLPEGVHAQLRPYQLSGYAWLCQMSSLGLGACLADDMGLGKTLQVLSWLEHLRQDRPDAHVLLVVPATLMGNWEKEAEKFTPSMPFLRLHGQSGAKLDEILRSPEALPFVTMTTYSMVSRLQALGNVSWDTIILDEAQAIKNPGTKQSRTIKELSARCRIAMTGTPIENNLANLWSLFDFLNQGLLGNAREFGTFADSLAESPEGYLRLRQMISPFILRRLKTDKTIISDLPDKIETTDFVPLSKKQAVLYRKRVDELQEILEKAEGIQRKGFVLSALTHLKQICNHPDQFMGADAFAEADSGKFGVLREICETIRDKHERVLIFTQYREIIPHLSEFLENVFGRPGLALHGHTRIKDRQRMVEEFNGEKYIPFMILSLRAGGTGLNLTAASHVVHFDRWWNPAVENQATDRAFRIGQKNQVIVHKFVARGTIEERIDEMIRAKSDLARNIVGDSGETWITEMSNEELLKMMRLEG